MTIETYNRDWKDFRNYVEKKAKDRCIISNKNWLKLRDYHFEKFIVTVSHPFGLMFKMIYMSTVHKQIPCIHRVYHKYRKQRIEQNTTQTSFRMKTRASAFKKYR